jgi:hypothetical protein
MEKKEKLGKLLLSPFVSSLHIYFNLKAQIGSFVGQKDKSKGKKGEEENVKIHLNKSIFTFKRTQNMAPDCESFVSFWGHFLFTVNFNLQRVDGGGYKKRGSENGMVCAVLHS